MMKKIYLLFYFLYGCFAYLNAQTVLNNPELTPRIVKDPNAIILTNGFHVSSNDISGVFRAKIGERSENTSTGGNGGSTQPHETANVINFQDTKGELTVDASGAANYKVPIALPPGIREVAPQIALTYTSSGTNGIAGYGWSITGISSIKKIGASKMIDGFTSPVNFDESDQFSLDGQRLIKLADGTLGTENFSNMKIIINGSYTSPDSFSIIFPDGSKAIYGGNSSSKSPIEWLITKWIDVYGNTINYEYSNTNNVVYINKIIWGGNEKITTEYKNVIEFKYKNRSRIESGYVKGHNIKSTTILDYISVFTNSNLFRKYQLEYTKNELNYEIVNKVTEYNELNQAANPIVFKYDKTENKLIQTDYKFNNTTLDLGRLDLKLSGDFDGDGHMDVFSKGKLFLNLFNTNNSAPKIVDIQSSNASLSTIISKLKDNDKIVQANGFGSYEGIGQSSGSISSNPKMEDDYKLRVSYRYFNGSNTLQEVASATVSFPHLNKARDTDRCMRRPNYDQFQGRPDVKLLEGDFNGDGISEVLILGQMIYNDTRLERSHNGNLRRPILGCNSVQFKHSTPTYYLDVYTNEYFRTNLNLNYDHRIDIFDSNGDGKDDIIAVDNSGYVSIFTFDDISKTFQQLNRGLPINERRFIEYDTYNHPDYINRNFNDVLIYGDFNGDGKIDALVPKAENNPSWSLYLSDGVKFYKKDIVIEPFEKNKTDRNSLTTYTYYPLDINGDGKSDLVKVYQRAYGGGSGVFNLSSNVDTSFQVFAYTNLNEDGEVKFDASCRGMYSTIRSNTCFKSQFYASDVKGLGYPLVGKFKNANSFFDLLLIKTTNGGTLHTYTFTKDQERDSRLISVEDSGNSISHQLEYTQLDHQNTSVYKSNNEEVYPNVEVKHLPNSFVVSKLIYVAPNVNKYKLYQYRGLTINQQGLGVLGFKRVAQSGWIVSGDNDGSKIPPYWEVSQSDPSKRGVNIASWTFNSVNTNLIDSYAESNLIGKTENTFNYTIFPDKRFILLPTTVVQKDMISGVVTTDVNKYDSYYNIIEKVETKTGNGQTFKVTVNNTLENFPNSVPYIIGRLAKEVSTSEAYGGTYTTQKEYIYSNHNISRTKITVQNAGTHQVDYTYDTFGNVLTVTDYGKIITGGGRKSVARKIESTYDNNGRFVIKKKDIEGYETHLEYNILGQVIKETDKFGASITTDYDKWGKLLQVTSHNSSEIPITTTYHYERDRNGWNIISQSNQTKAYSRQYFDAVGNNIKNTVKGFSNGEYISTSIEYDALGRKLRESEPYTSTPSQWTSYEYDYLLRPTKITNYTGLVATNVYDGLTTTAIEGVRSKKITKDAVGNTSQLVDNGTETIKYAYYPHGGVKTTTYGSHVITTDYDVWGRRTLLLDPSVSATPYTYSHTSFDETREEKTPEATTVYQYDRYGKVLERTTTGKTNIFVKYTYDSSKKGLLIKEEGTNEGNTFTNTLAYDKFFRISRKTESIPTFTFGKYYIYDALGRLEYDESWTTHHNKRVQEILLNHQYNSYNGELNTLIDVSKRQRKIVWKTNAKNVRGQVLNATLGERITIENTYDAYGNITSIRNKRGNDWLYAADYHYQVDRGLLLNRHDYHFNWREEFKYDNFDRLLSWSSPNGTNHNTYLTDGRIDENNQVGKYSYNGIAKYKKEAIELNPSGTDYYSKRKVQEITYDAFKRPLSIVEQGRGKVDFQYSINGGRFHAVKRDEIANKTVEKFYSADGTIEIKKEDDGTIKVINYISSTYNTPFIFVTELNSSLTTTKEGYYYLGRDFQGSIMAIYDEHANVVERRLFDPWGNIVKVADRNGKITEGENAKLIFLDRGYTGHEHFTEVGIIHMNGRIYDPVLKQFLSPDNFIQDPENSQSYNRYGYAWNNPLKYTDPSGEVIIEAMVVGAIMGGFFYAGNAMLNDNFSIGGLFKSTFFGALGGMASAGVGKIAASISASLSKMAISSTLTNVISVSSQTLMHGVSQGIIAGVSSGDFNTFGSAFISSAVSSLMSSATQGMLKKLNLNPLSEGNGAITMLMGTASGGLAAELSGGNFWQGAIRGFMISTYNHLEHSFKLEQFSTTIDKELNAAGYDVYGKTTQTKEYATKMLNSVKSLKWAKKESSKNLYISSVVDRLFNPDGSQAYGSTAFKTNSIVLSKKAFASNTFLAIVIYHEAMHFVYAYNPVWIKQLKSNSNFKSQPGEWEDKLYKRRI